MDTESVSHRWQVQGSGLSEQLPGGKEKLSNPFPHSEQATTGASVVLTPHAREEDHRQRIHPDRHISPGVNRIPMQSLLLFPEQFQTKSSLVFIMFAERERVSDPACFRDEPGWAYRGTV